MNATDVANAAIAEECNLVGTVGHDAAHPERCRDHPRAVCFGHRNFILRKSSDPCPSEPSVAAALAARLNCLEVFHRDLIVTDKTEKEQDWCHRSHQLRYWSLSKPNDEGGYLA